MFLSQEQYNVIQVCFCDMKKKIKTTSSMLTLKNLENIYHDVKEIEKETTFVNGFGDVIVLIDFSHEEYIKNSLKES